MTFWYGTDVHSRCRSAGPSRGGGESGVRREWCPAQAAGALARRRLAPACRGPYPDAGDPPPNSTKRKQIKQSQYRIETK